MLNKEWIKVKSGAAEGAVSSKRVEKSGMRTLRSAAVDNLRKESTRIVYEVGGVWKGTFEVGAKRYDTVAAPGGALSTDEGAPEIPQEGIYVAVANGAINVKVKVVEREMTVAKGKWMLKPAPKPIVEEEYIEGKEQIKPKKAVYDSDKEYPGKDFDFLGVKMLEGIPVAHLIVYLAQYKPASGVLSLVKKMVLEISYDVPADTDAFVKRRAIEPTLSDLILDYKNVQAEEETDSKEQGFEAGAFFGGIDGKDGLSMDPAGTVTTYPVMSTTPVISTTIPVVTTIPGVVLSIIKLKRTDIASEYVIITSGALKASVDPLLKAKTGWPHYGMVATTETIVAEFPAASLKESIKAFLTYAWNNWRVPPRYVVLAGDTDTIPVDMKTIGGGTYASDNYYADISGSLVPEIMMARLPTSNATEMLQICQRLANYANVRGPDWGGWQSKALLVAYQADTYKGCSDDIATAVAPRFSVTKLYGDSSTKQQVINAINGGTLIVNYRGHGSKTDWSSANGLTVGDISALTNANAPSLVFCICCQNGWIDDNSLEVVAETFLRDGKAVAVLGASRNSPTYANNDFDKYLFQAIMDGETNPGGIVKRAKALMIANHANSSTHEQDVVMYILFGDPTAPVVSTVEFLRGTWDMDHDGWQGVLNINRIWQHRIERAGNCGYPVWSISGTYTSGGKTYNMTGRIGGLDSNDLNPGCKRTDHRVEFTIAFEAANPQKFVGYVTTWTRNMIAGITWWAKRPFGWYAKKRPA